MPVAVLLTRLRSQGAVLQQHSNDGACSAALISALVAGLASAAAGSSHKHSLSAAVMDVMYALVGITPENEAKEVQLLVEEYVAERLRGCQQTEAEAMWMLEHVYRNSSQVGVCSQGHDFSGAVGPVRVYSMCSRFRLSHCLLLCHGGCMHACRRLCLAVCVRVCGVQAARFKKKKPNIRWQMMQ